MGKRGPKPKPILQVVREGNPSHRPVGDPLVLPPTAVVEPKWSEWFGGQTRDMRTARSRAHDLWQRTAPVLTRSAGLVDSQREVLIEWVVTSVRIQQIEHRLSLDGLLVLTERGWVKNPLTTVATGYRSHWRSLIGELGLSPSAASSISRSDGAADDGDDVLTG